MMSSFIQLCYLHDDSSGHEFHAIEVAQRPLNFLAPCCCNTTASKEAAIITEHDTCACDLHLVCQGLNKPKMFVVFKRWLPKHPIPNSNALYTKILTVLPVKNWFSFLQTGPEVFSAARWRLRVRTEIFQPVNTEICTFRHNHSLR
jgi:hypothetical protein